MESQTNFKFQMAMNGSFLHVTMVTTTVGVCNKLDWKAHKSFLQDRQKEGSIRKVKAPWGHPVQTAMGIVAPWTEIAATLSERKFLRIRRRCAGHERMAN